MIYTWPFMYLCTFISLSYCYWKMNIDFLVSKLFEIKALKYREGKGLKDDVLHFCLTCLMFWISYWFSLIQNDDIFFYVALVFKNLNVTWNLYSDVYTNNWKIITVWFHSQTFYLRRRIILITYFEVQSSKYFWLK